VDVASESGELAKERTSHPDDNERGKTYRLGTNDSLSSSFSTHSRKGAKRVICENVDALDIISSARYFH
jgi:hypothetical protein